LEATVGQKNGQIDEGVASLEEHKNQWLECDTHKNVTANRVKTVQVNNEKTKSNEKRVQSRALW
jgi:hypothetical protein